MLKNSIYIMNHFDKRFDKYRNMKNNDWHRYSQFSLPHSYIKKGWKTIDFFLQIFKKPLTFANLKDITSKQNFIVIIVNTYVIKTENLSEFKILWSKNCYRRKFFQRLIVPQI